MKSIEADFVYNKSQQVQLKGTLSWINHHAGRTLLATELLLKQRYPSFTDKELLTSWASHIQAGIIK